MTSWYAAAGTALSASFWSVRVSMASDWTGLVTNTEPVAVAPVPVPAAGAAVAAPTPASSRAPADTVAMIVRMGASRSGEWRPP